MTRPARRCRMAVGFTCGCEHPWRRHGFYGCKYEGCGCQCRIIAFETHRIRGIVRIVLEMPLKGGKAREDGN